MKIKKYLILIICAIVSQITFSQNQLEETEKPKNDIIKFTNGSTKEGKVILRGIHRPSKNRKIKLCDKNYKNCEKYKLADINEIIINSSPGDHTNINELFANARVGDTIDLTNLHAVFKILYNPKKRSDIPLAGKLIFEGENHNYYSFNKSGTNSNTLRSYDFYYVYISEKGSNSIKYRFDYWNNKNIVKKLKGLFSNCSGIVAESKKKKKTLKKKSLIYFLEILDKCL